MSQGEHGEGSKAPASFLCDYLGISRQGYYKHADRSLEVDVLRSSIVLYAREVLKDMPKAGMRELHELCRRHFGQKFTIGRDQCYEIFRSNGLCQRKRKRPRTTCSNHNYFIHGDLLNTTPKLVATRFGQLCVADITYVATNAGWAYLSLLTERPWVEPPTHIGQGRPHRGVEHGTRTVQGIRCGRLTAHPPLGSRRAVLLQ